MIVRILIVFGVSTVVVAVAIALRRWRAGLYRAIDPGRHALPAVPPDLVAGAERTWLVFTTPYCASCGPVIDHLRQTDPDARVVTVDAAAQSALAATFQVRSAPTVLLAGTDGEVQAHLVGPRAVRRYVENQLAASIR